MVIITTEVVIITTVNSRMVSGAPGGNSQRNFTGPMSQTDAQVTPGATCVEIAIYGRCVYLNQLGIRTSYSCRNHPPIETNLNCVQGDSHMSPMHMPAFPACCATHIRSHPVLLGAIECQYIIYSGQHRRAIQGARAIVSVGLF